MNGIRGYPEYLTTDKRQTDLRRFGPAAVASGTSTVFTGSANHVYACQGLRIVNNGTVARLIRIGIGGVADANLILPSISIAPGAAFDDPALFVLVGTETLQVATDGTGLTMSGAYSDQA